MKTKTSKTLGNSTFSVSVLAMALAGILISLPGCNDDDDNSAGDGDTDTDTNFECSEGKNGWEQCLDNKVQWCHIVEGIDPHFHWGADCESLGLDCIELSESEAACLDESTECTVGDFHCEENTAYNCVDHGGHGHWTIEPCGTAATCQEQADEASCKQEEGDFDPQDACDAMTGSEEEVKAVVTTFADVFAPDYHADLGKRVQVTLPDNQTSYIHFPVFYSGEFAVFMDQTDVLDGIQHRDQTEMTVSGGTAVTLCSEDIPEHWHADLAWDGEGAEGESPVPYVIRFKAVTGGGDVNFAVFQIAGEE